MDEKLIEDYMKKLEISREEAIQLIKDDEEDYIGEEGEEMQKKAKQLSHREESGKRKNRNLERKVDNIKLEFLQTMAAAIEEDFNIEVEIEKEVNFHFNYGNEDYSVKLIRHRPKKK